MSPYLRTDKEVSALARKLRGFSDSDLEWFPYLSAAHQRLVCEHLATTPHLLLRAHAYETARRQTIRPSR